MFQTDRPKLNQQLPDDLSVHKWYFTKKQTQALEILEDPNVIDLLYGGAKGGGKTVLLCRWAYLQAIKLINLFKIFDYMKHPLPVGFIGRKRASDFNKTTLETWKKMIPGELYQLRSHEKEIIIDDKVKLFYGGMDDQTNINKFNSAEFAFICLDQAEELEQTDLGLLKGTLRLKYNDMEPQYKVFLTANPAPCFLRQEYILAPPKDGSKVFLRALPADNAFLPSNYVDTLTEAFKHRPELVNAYVHGSWDDLEGSDLVIQHKWCLNCVDRSLTNVQEKKVTVCDIARYGDDETVIYNMIDSRIDSEEIYGMKDATHTASRIIQNARNHKSDAIAIDADGMGAPVYDFLLKMTDIPVIEIRSGKKAQKPDIYYNSKAEMLFHAARVLAEAEACIPNDPVLIGQLSSIKYQINTGGKFQIERATDIKKRLNQSPDRAMAFVYGVWAQQYIHKKKYDFNRQDAQPAYRNDSYGWNVQNTY